MFTVPPSCILFDNMTELAKQPVKAVEQPTNPTNKQIFTPTDNQLKWLDTALQIESDSITDISEQCGLDRSCWYDWNKKPEFRAWYIAEWNERIKIIGVQLDKMGIKNARRDYKYWEAMQKRVGNLKDQEVRNVNNIQVVIEDFTA